MNADARRSLEEYEQWRKNLHGRLDLSPPPEDDLREVNGWIREALTVAQRLASDAGDSDLTQGVAGHVNHTVAWGNLLARRNQTYGDAG